MAALYGHSWVSQYGASPDGIGADTWSGVLGDMTNTQIAAGMRAASELGGDWPPSAPRFRALCLGVPSIATVRGEMPKQRRRPPGSPALSPFVALVIRHIDMFRYWNADGDRQDRMFREAYECAVAIVLKDGAMPQAPAGEIEAPKPEPRTPASTETARAAMDDIAAKLEPEPQP